MVDKMQREIARLGSGADSADSSTSWHGRKRESSGLRTRRLGERRPKRGTRRWRRNSATNPRTVVPKVGGGRDPAPSCVIDRK